MLTECIFSEELWLDSVLKKKKKTNIKKNIIKLQPAIFPLSKHVIHLHELPAEEMQHILQ